MDNFIKEMTHHPFSFIKIQNLQNSPKKWLDPWIQKSKKYQSIHKNLFSKLLNPSGHPSTLSWVIPSFSVGRLHPSWVSLVWFPKYLVSCTTRGMPSSYIFLCSSLNMALLHYATHVLIVLQSILFVLSSNLVVPPLIILFCPTYVCFP